MSEDSVDRLEKLSALHRNGELSDQEFAAAKESVLEPSEQADSLPPTRSLAVGSHDGGPRTATDASAPRRRPLWRRGWVIAVAIFCGFMFGAVGTAAIPSSAMWTGGIVCSSPYHLVHQSSDTSFGNTSQSSVSFRCIDGAGNSKSAATFAIFGLQFLLGTLVAYGVLVAFGTVLSLSRRPSRA